MDIFKLLDEVEDLVENSSNLPLSSKSMIDKRELMELINELRIKLPDELKQAEWIKDERQRILYDAQNEADNMIKEVQVHIEDMINSHEVITEAEKRAEEILERAKISAKEVRIGAREYADSLLGGVENHLKQIGARVNETVSLLELNRQELNENN